MVEESAIQRIEEYFRKGEIAWTKPSRSESIYSGN